MLGKYETWRSFTRFLETDCRLAIFLIMILFCMFVLPSLGFLGVSGRFMVDIFFSLLLISGIA